MSTHDANPESKSVWLLSPYHTGSHASWAKGYQEHSGHRVELLTMAGRFWKWRMQGGAIELAEQIKSQLVEGSIPDVILATDMVNLSGLQGLLRKQLSGELSQTQFWLYMHENQLTYPWRPGEKPDLTYAMINWTSQLCADLVIFNSHYHRDSWFGELPNLLKHYPDYNHLSLIDEVRNRSVVLPVGIACSRILAPYLVSGSPRQDRGEATEISFIDGGKDNPSRHTSALAPLILWNQRWEYDKRPDLFFNALYRLDEMGIKFRLAVAGENFRNVPQEFEDARARLADVIVHWGYLDSYVDYVALLHRADLVISTAIHEFLGISVLEAIVAGAYPLLPNRLSYPELIPEALHPACLYEDESDLVTMAAQRLQRPRPAPPSLQAYVVSQFDWPAVAERYDEQVKG